MKKALSLILTLLLVLGLAPALALAEEAAPLFDEPWEINIMATTWAPHDSSVTVIWDEIERLTNVKLNFEWAPQTDYNTKVGTVLASGIDAMPDLIAGASQALLFDQGAVIPLDDYLDLIPNITSLMTDEDMIVWREVFDGHIYTIPNTQDMPGAMSFMIRRDWLNRVGKEIPTTWDELVDVLIAFRDNDANGDGDPTNEIPFAVDTQQGGGMGLDGLCYIFGINPTGNGQFCILEDGTYTLIYEHPNFEAMAEAARMLYTEGLLDPEFATRDQTALFGIMDNGMLGFTLTWAERCRISSDVNAEVDPDAEWVCIAPPAGPNGNQMIRARAKLGKAYHVTVAAEQRGKVEDIMIFMNWLFGEEGTRLMNYGIEGTHYELVDGNPVLLPPYNESFVVARQAGLVHQPFVFLWSNDVYMQLLTGGLSYEELSPSSQRFFDGLFTINNDYFVVQPTTYQTEAWNEYQAEIIRDVRVLRDKLYSGQIDYAEFRAEYEKLLPRGLQEIIDQGGEAYAMLQGA